MEWQFVGKKRSCEYDPRKCVQGSSGQMARTDENILFGPGGPVSSCGNRKSYNLDYSGLDVSSLEL